MRLAVDVGTTTTEAEVEEAQIEVTAAKDCTDLNANQEYKYL
jgi:hypothetical protein